jgi:hypothetical protein
MVSLNKAVLILSFSFTDIIDAYVKFDKAPSHFSSVE